MYKILIVEDEENISQVISDHFKGWGYEVKRVNDFKNVIKDFLMYQPHLVLLDIKLPFYDGYYWCQEIRKVSKVPIIFISSADDDMNIVMAMSLGGDDFIAKPFDLSVLTAKVQAILRRTYDFTTDINILEYQGLLMSVDDNRVTYQEQQMELSKNEARILKILLENKGKIVDRNTLMNYLWQTDSYVDENTLSVNVNRLRKRLESIGAFGFIKTKKGIGYILE